MHHAGIAARALPEEQTHEKRATAIGGASVENRIFVLGTNAYTTESGYYGLQGYVIHYDAIIVPQAGVTLPALTSSPIVGRYSGIIVMDGLSYRNGTGWGSALTAAQWTEIYNYQIAFSVRMVRINEYPRAEYG
jgi:predicted anti-sigma-YlaC factor YlaD